ncbi:MAG TPA: substrate-binding domain-containing protein, partial [Coriobacteriia bacterium]
MSIRRLGVRSLGVVAVFAMLAAACSSNNDNNTTNPSTSNASCTQSGTPVITLAAYSNVYDVYGKLISTFQDVWKAKHDNQQVIFQTSFGGSTTQAQNVVDGFPADIVALSLDPDVQLIQDAGLITHEWQNDTENSIVASSAVVFDVRPGNPKHIENWNDLTQPGLQILTPDPAQSGGARWNLVSLWGSGLRGDVPGVAKGDEAAATTLMQGVVGRVL